MADPPVPPPPGQGDPPPGYGSQPPPPGYGQPPQQQYPPPKKQRGCARNLLIALGVFLAFLVVIAAIIGIVDDGDDDDDVARDVTTEEDDNGDANGDDESDTRNLDLYPDRADRQSDDHEAELGQSVRLVGYTVSVDEATMSDDGLGGADLVISVSIENRDDDAQPYSFTDWRIQTEDGQVLDPILNIRDDDLGSGDIVGGGTTTGTVAFNVDPGTYYVIYKPDPLSAHRGIWRIEV